MLINGMPFLLWISFLIVYFGIPSNSMNNNGKANPAAIITFGPARFTILTDRMFRIEISTTKVFEDRPSLVIINRNLPVPKFSHYISNGTLSLRTSYLNLSYTPGASYCSSQINKDADGGQRTTGCPNGLSNQTQDTCCDACDQDSECIIWIFALIPAKSGKNCWLMRSITKIIDAHSRILGRKNRTAKLSIRFDLNGKVVQWNGQRENNPGNLLGTISSWNEVDPNDVTKGPFPEGLSQGLLSTEGWSIWDDSKTPLFNSEYNIDETHLPWTDGPATGRIDFYILAYGHKYMQALSDFTLVSGKIPLPPRSAFGVWWSHFEAYNQSQFISEVLTGFANYSLPLNHVVLDMDWHIEPKNVPGCKSFGGFTWNTELWPDYTTFIDQLHNGTSVIGRSLKIGLNTHSFLGIDHCQDQYRPLANALHFDISDNKTIPLVVTNKMFVTNFFKYVLDTNPIDFWWTDGSFHKWPNTGTINPWNLFWFSYIHDAHLRQAEQRTLVLARFGGFGNHRYPIGFSGDADASWITLRAEINITKTAANVLFAYWSHDIGGFRGDPTDELMVRWAQFGAVSPIYRSHGQKGTLRRPWKYPSWLIIREAYQLRARLAPYLYTSARKAYDTGVAAIHPLYYHHSEMAESYQYNFQYMFGENMLVRPIEVPINTKSSQTCIDIWLPPRQQLFNTFSFSNISVEHAWVNWNSSQPITAGKHTICVSLNEFPIFVSAGAVIPLFSSNSMDATDSSLIVWAIFNGNAASGTGVLYEDDGITNVYETINNRQITNKNIFATTTVSWTISHRSMDVIIPSVVGNFSGMPTIRAHNVELRGWNCPINVSVNGIPLKQGSYPGWNITHKHTLHTPINTPIIYLKPSSVFKVIKLHILF